MNDQTCLCDDLEIRPYWWRAAPPAPPASAELPAQVDVAVVGGGYTGLSAGLELARNGATVVVLDRLPIGAGASSRNGGSVGGGLKLAGFDLRRRLGADRAGRVLAEAMATLDFLEELIGRERIDCRFARSGRYVAAWSRRHLDILKRRAEALGAAGQRATVLEPGEQSAELGSRRYHGGMLLSAGAQVHPGLYVQGLAHAAARAGAVLAGGVEVTTYRRQRDGGFTVDWTDQGRHGGELRARHLAIATNAYTGSLTPWLRRRVIPVNSYMIATEPFDPELRGRLDPNGRMFSDTKRLLSYFRMAPGEDRALIGGRVSFGEVDERVAAIRLHRELTAIWPELTRVRVSHAWKGRVAFTFDYLPHLGEREAVHYAVGCQGAGIAMCSYLGTRMAQRILGAPGADTAFADSAFTDSASAGPGFPTRPFYSGDPWFLPLVGAGYRALDAFDRHFR